MAAFSPWSGMDFFFQAEDGIRDHCVTGVQTCALPILVCSISNRPLASSRIAASSWSGPRWRGRSSAWRALGEIGRASCRERAEIAVVDVAGIKKAARVGGEGRVRTWIGVRDHVVVHGPKGFCNA